MNLNNIKYKLYLDDIRDPTQTYQDTLFSQWAIVRSYDEFCNFITMYGLPEFISYDHDLGESHYNPTIDPKNYVEKTGYDCCKWLVNYCIDNNKPHPMWKVHSMNPVGRKNIESYIRNFEDSLAIHGTNYNTYTQVQPPAGLEKCVEIIDKLIDNLKKSM